MRALQLFLVLSLSIATGAQASLKPEAVHSNAIQSLVAGLESHHYREQAVDDELSEKLFNNFFETIDPTRSYLLQSDIDSLAHFKRTLDDDMRSGNLTFAFAAYERFLTRFQERTEQMIDALKSDQTFDFTLDDRLPISREEKHWFQSKGEQDQYWSLRLKSAVLNLKLSDKSVSEAKETLIKRYESQLNRALQTNSEDIFQSYANALARLYDPHTAYFSPATSENFEINMSLSLEGIGAVLQSEDEFTKIVSLVPAGPADKSGQLKPADLIVGVGQDMDGEIEDVVGMRLDDVVDRIRGPKGSIVRLEIIPSTSADKSTRKIVKLERQRVKLEEQAAKSRIMEVERDGNIYKVGIIDIPTFYIDFAALRKGDKDYRSTTRDVAVLIEDLKQQGVDALVVDLRENGGGSLREANELVGLFISRGPTVQIRDLEGRVDVLGDYNPETTWTGPLTVVIDRLSASASEIFAGAIQDYRRGLVVGSRTFGKGTVQTLQPLRHGQLKFTTAKFYRISGESTQHQGVAPDIEFPSMFDQSEIGESALDFALPWDKVRPVRYGSYSSLDRWVPELQNRHTQRTQTDHDFQHMRDTIALINEQKSMQWLPLNEEQLKAQRDQMEQAQIDLENQRRMAKGEQPIKTLDELLTETAPGEEITDPDSEAVLREASELSIDMIEMFFQEDQSRLAG
ncbi:MULTISPECIES: carboxy terminal-processing peptidase [unclassified Marinobacterium]|uniref:carboxy terminal-processing peptidase n=1 Tax=unclassified Marinobacterium TaxID=2644139 RepID=UPI00156917B7|nr:MULTISPECIES: carboxy terminal-processing peptidase [unclassified Marinobacterium]NRP28398.1 Tail-specific protease precursor [Marinobacterium sp. xm-d-420]NRP57503.1 Tail-specific protease precursor [Marinobacterium sp. xm-d-510]NRP98015.1 Tail-specific protease precursor [Marinobacterium sp. xm-a-127]